MGTYQNTSVTSSKLILGNAKIETAASVADTYVNLGAGTITNFVYTPTMYDTQAGNAPDPVEGIADEECTIDGELITRWGNEAHELTDPLFLAPHGIAVDSHGDIYVGEVSLTSAKVDRGSRTIQKFSLV